MARRHRRLGATKRVHALEAEHAAQSLRSEINKAVAALKRGSCHGALSHITAAYEAEGVMKAHGRSSGNTQWFPLRAMMDVNGKFNDVCIVPDRVDVGTNWSPALAGRRRARRGRRR